MLHNGGAKRVVIDDDDDVDAAQKLLARCYHRLGVWLHNLWTDQMDERIIREVMDIAARVHVYYYDYY